MASAKGVNFCVFVSAKWNVNLLNGCLETVWKFPRLDTYQSNKVKARIGEDIWDTVEFQLRNGQWSPEQISNALEGTHRKKVVNPEWIYHYVREDKANGGDLYKHLRCQKKRRKKYGGASKRGVIPNRAGIKKRPAIVGKKGRTGDWEVDTIIGQNHQQTMVMLTERK